MRLGWLDGTAAKDIARSTRSSKRETRLWLGTCKTWVTQQTVRAMHCTWSHGYWLVEMHRLSWLRLVLWRLFQPLTFLLFPNLSVLLFLDVDLLNFAHSLALPVRCRRLPRRLA